LEEISQRVKMILKSFNLQSTQTRRDSGRDSEVTELVTVSDPEKLAFLKAFFSFHPTKFELESPCSDTMTVQVGLSHGAPTFYVNSDAISVRKCLIGLQDTYIKTCQTYAEVYCN